jgi:hypothetical protein
MKKETNIDPLEIKMDDFIKTYKPIKNITSEGRAYDGCMFETYGPELQKVKEHKQENIWTVIDGGGIHLDIIAGFHFVNRLGYIVTEKPWDNKDQFIHD